MDKYIVEKELVGFQPDGPNWNVETNSYDDGTIVVPKNTMLKAVNFDEYSIEFEIEKTGKRVSLHRKTVCEDVSSPRYYDNYFAPIEGLKRILQ